LAGLPSLSGAPMQGHGSIATARPDARKAKARSFSPSVAGTYERRLRAVTDDLKACEPSREILS